MDVKERMKRYRARLRGEDVPRGKPGPKPWSPDRNTTETPPEVHRNATKTPLRERVFVDMEATPEVEEPKKPKEAPSEPTDLQNWREKRLGQKVVYQCRGCGTWWPARHNVGCRHE